MMVVSSLFGVLRALTPVGWTAVFVATLCGLGLVLGGLGFRWDPFDLSRRRAERVEQAAARAGANAAARETEAFGQAGQVVRLDAALTSTRSLDRATHHAIQIASAADDASLPLPSDRADRLRDHDRELCRIIPDLVGCSTPADPSDPGEPSV